MSAVLLSTAPGLGARPLQPRAFLWWLSLASRAPGVVPLRLQSLAATSSAFRTPAVWTLGFIHWSFDFPFFFSVFLLHDFIADIKKPGLWLPSVHTEGTIGVLRLRGEGQGPSSQPPTPTPNTQQLELAELAVVCPEVVLFNF